MKDRPNILLIGMDAVRFDHLSCYGYQLKTTPNIDQIVEEGVLFENAFAAAPWTPPSFASIFTGTYPSRHGVKGANLYLRDRIPYLPEILSSNGYRTLGVTCAFLSRKRGFARGYQDFIEKWHLPRFGPQTDTLYNMVYSFIFGRDAHAYHVNRLIKRWLSANKQKPFFIFAHYGNAHNPYYSPWPFRRRFVVPKNLDLKKLRKVVDKAGGYRFMAGKIPMIETEWKAVKAWYDNAILYIDFRLSELFSHLKKIGVFDNTVIIITSDHGENFGERGLANHQFCLYDTLLHVPLIIYYPALLKRMKISSLTSLVDIFSTLLELVGIDSAVYDGVQSRGLLPLGEKETYHEYVFAEYGPPITALKALKRVHPEYDASVYDRSLKCVRTKKFKYILSSDGREELYYLTHDPEELRNAVNQFPDEAKKLRKILDDNLGKFGENRELLSEKEEDDATRRRLRELGYF